MPKKRKPGNQKVDIKVGNMSRISGPVNIAGGDINQRITTGLNAAEIKLLFDGVYRSIETRPNTSAEDKEDLKTSVEKIQVAVTEAAQKNEPVKEGFVATRLRNIMRVAPDILDVVVKTLANPVLGLADLANKIAKKANEGTSSG